MVDADANQHVGHAHTGAELPLLQLQRTRQLFQRALEIAALLQADGKVVVAQREAGGRGIGLAFACTKGLPQQFHRFGRRHVLAHPHADVFVDGAGEGFPTDALPAHVAEHRFQFRAGAVVFANVAKLHRMAVARFQAARIVLAPGGDRRGSGRLGKAFDIAGFSQLLVDAQEHGEQLRANLRIALVALLHLPAATFQQFRQRGRARGFHAIAQRLEQGFQEGLHLVGAGGLQPRHPGLPQRHAQRGKDRKQEGRRGRHPAAMARNELAGAVPVRGRVRCDRQVRKMPPDVFGQRAGRGVAALRLFRDGFQHDVVQIAAQQFAHGLRRRRQGLRFDGVGDTRGGAAGFAGGAAFAGDQFVQQDAERVNVGGGGDVAANLLFGRGVGRREGGSQGAVFVRGVKQLGDAEIQQAHPTVAGDQHIGGLDVPVHDQGAVRGIHGMADVGEQRQPRGKVEPVRAGILGDGHAFDQFQRDVGLAGVGDAGVDQAGDVGMPKLQQGTAFVLEAAARIGTVQAAMQQLQRHALGHPFDIALGLEHGGKAALADGAHDAERADAAMGRRRRPVERGRIVLAQPLGDALGPVALQGIARAHIGFQQRQHAGAQDRVGAMRLQVRKLLRRRLFQHGIEQGAQRIRG